MKSQRQKVTEDDGETILGRSSRAVTIFKLPIDLIMEIFSRLPVKSIARCRCVSKPWAFILGRPDFRELFLTRSSVRPQLLIAVEEDSELFFFSTPQNDEKSCPVAANYHMKVRCGDVREIFSPFSGLVCFRDERILKGRKKAVMVLTICNPSTGQSFTLPKIMTKRRDTPVISFFGYDPIEKQTKVLAMTSAHDKGHGISKEHQVLTLGTDEKPSWRMIECGIPHYPASDGICINGVLYYVASVSNLSKGYMIVCFDVSSEKFSSIKLMETFIRGKSVMVNYKGNLALLMLDGFYYLTQTKTNFKMWVYEDQEWSEHIYVPPMLQNVVGDEDFLNIVGVTGTNEIVLSPSALSYPFYILYYSFERRSFRRVEIQGMGVSKDNLKWVFTLLDHVEDVKLMQPF